MRHLAPAGRVGNTLYLGVTPFGDNQRGDTGAGFFCPVGCGRSVTGRYTLDQDGTKIAGGNAALAAGDRRATVGRRGGGTFMIAFTAPAGANVTTRVSATDAAGGSITETIARAYHVA